MHTDIMPQVGFEPTIPVFEWVKTVHALDRAATVAGFLFELFFLFLLSLCFSYFCVVEIALYPLRYSLYWSRDSTVGIATGCGKVVRGVGVRVPARTRIFSSPHGPYRFWGPPSLLSNGYRGLFPRGKADYSPPTSGEVKKTWIFTSTPPYIFMA
jgi:hypothetical protein